MYWTSARRGQTQEYHTTFTQLRSQILCRVSLNARLAEFCAPEVGFHLEYQLLLAVLTSTRRLLRMALLLLLLLGGCWHC